MRRLFAILIPALAILATSPAWGGGPATAHERHRPHHRAYVALGDSLAFGVGASDPAATGYVPLLADEFDGHGHGRRHLDVINMGVQFGETSTRFVQNGQLTNAVALLEDRNDNRRRSDNVTVVTLDIGGNDVAALAAPCGGGPTPACFAAVQATLTGYAANLDLALGQLREAAGRRTRIIVMTYYNALVHPACPLNANAAFGDLVLEGGGPIPAGLNDVIRAVAAEHDAEVTETFGLLGQADLVGDCLHPNDAGYRKIAAAFDAA